MLRIDAEQFLAMQAGARVVAQNEGGQTLKSEDGKLFARVHNGTDWEYFAFP